MTATERAYWTEGEQRPGPWLFTCDHATNRVPPWVCPAALGLPPADLARHIAYDPGAAGVTSALAEALNSPAIFADFSRLVIDPNRGADDPTLIMQLYDGSLIPGNRALSADQIVARQARLYRPYHAALAALAAARPAPVIVALHSFTPCLSGRAPRPWHIGVLSSPLDRRLSDALLARLAQEPDLCVGDNEPYAGHLPGDSIDRHALGHGRLHTLIELRQDLIANAAAQKAWAARLAPLLTAARASIDPKYP